MQETAHERAMRRVEQTHDSLLGTEFILEGELQQEPTVALVGSIDKDRAYCYDRDGREFIVPVSTLTDGTFDPLR